MPTLEPALQLPVPQGILFTTPSPSAGLELLEAALQSGGCSPAQHPYKLPLAPEAVSWPPWTAAALCSLPPRSTVPSALDACPQVPGFYSASWWPSLQTVPGPVPSSFLTAQMTQADVLGLMPSGTPAAARVMTYSLLSHLAGPQTQAQQGPTESPGACGQGTLLQVSAHAEHAHVSSVPSGCCSFQGF